MTTTNAAVTATTKPRKGSLAEFRDQVFRVAVEAKIAEGWCDSGFNRALMKLGFRPVRTVWVEPVFGPEPPHDGPAPTPKPDYQDTQCPTTCVVCYDNPTRYDRPRPVITPGRYVLQYVDGDQETVTYADGTEVEVDRD